VLGLIHLENTKDDEHFDESEDGINDITQQKAPSFNTVNLRSYRMQKGLTFFV